MLPPHDWRTLYNVADALRPASGESPASDPLAELRGRSCDASTTRSLRLTLRGLEVEARLRFSPTRGFSWLARPERRALLARWERSPFAFRREAFLRLRNAVGASPACAPQSRPGA